MKTLNTLLLLVLCLCVTNWATAQGQDCSTATSTGFGLNTASYTGNGALNSCYTGSTSSSWHFFVPANDGVINVSACEQGQDTRLSLHAGSCATMTTCIAQSDDVCLTLPGGNSWASEVTNVPVTAGDTIFIEWEDRWTSVTHNWILDYSYCGSSNFDVQVAGSDATVSWNTASTNPYTYAYGPQGATDPLLFTPVSGMSGSMVVGMANGIYDFYLTDSCFQNGISLGATAIGPITVCVPGYTGMGVNAAPITESFEECGGALSGFWTQSTMDVLDWTHQTGATSSTNTGPSGANDGTHYIYLETSTGGLGNDAVISTGWVDVNALSIPSLRFDYHMFGADMGSLDVEITSDSTWTNVWSLSGDQGDQWNTATVNLAGMGDTIMFRFTATRGNGFTSDASIDHFRVEEFCLPVMAAPYMENFEGGASCMTNSMMDVLDWTNDDNGTPSTGTGPAMGNENSQYYAYVEATGQSQGDSAIYMTSLVDISGLTYPELTFAYHMLGPSMGSLSAEITNDGGVTWMMLWEKSGNQGDEWHMERINLDNVGITADTIQVRFTGVIGTGFTSDMSIDDVSFANGVALDLLVTEDMTMYPSCASSGVPASFEVTNFGFADITIPFTYGVEVNGTLISQTFTDTIPTGTSTILTFNTGLDLMPGVNTLSYGFVGVDFGDEDMTNDILDVVVTTADVADGDAYASSYEGSEDGWYGTGDFAWGTPAATIITGASDGTDAWVTSLAGDYSDSEMSYLHSPCFDFSSYASDPNVTFDVYWDIEDGWDAAWLETSIDGGNTFSKVGTMGTGTNWYTADVSANNAAFGEGWNGTGANNSGGWVTASNRTMGTAGEASVQFRFVVASDAFTSAEGLGIDNFKIEDYCPADLGLGTVVTTATSGAAGDASASVSATVGTAPYSYLWSDGQTTAIATGLDGGIIYTVTVIDANGCTDTATVSTLFTSTDLIETMTSFDVFPNPTNTTANVVLAFEEALDVNIELVNVLGQVIFTDRQEGATKVNLAYDVSNLSAGVYMVRIMANGQKTSRRLVITE